MDIYSLGSLGQSKGFTLTKGRGKTPVDGLALRMPWDKLEPTEGVIDWTLVDAASTLATAAGVKKLSLSVTAGIFTPTWVYDAGALSFMGTAYGRLREAPVPWDATYLSKWTAFVALWGSQRAGHFTNVKLTGINFETQETLLPPEILQVQGYSYTNLESAWETIGDAFAAAFPGVPFFAMHGRDFIPAIGRGHQDTETGVLIDIGIDRWPGQYGAQWNGWISKPWWPELDGLTCQIGLQEGAPVGNATTINAAVSAAGAIGVSFGEFYGSDLALVAQ